MIDVAKAAAQHSIYEQALATAGLEVTRLPDLPQHADGERYHERGMETVNR
jgi:N-dimethylarginine dimethylaminohydrolase